MAVTRVITIHDGGGNHKIPMKYVLTKHRIVLVRSMISIDPCRGQLWQMAAAATATCGDC